MQIGVGRCWVLGDDGTRVNLLLLLTHQHLVLVRSELLADELVVLGQPERLLRAIVLLDRLDPLDEVLETLLHAVIGLVLSDVTQILTKQVEPLESFLRLPFLSLPDASAH